MDLVDILQGLAVVLLVALLTALALLALLARKLRRLNLPPDAGVMDTLRALPFGFVVALDLLDLSLDIFSAPVSWYILTRLRLEKLRQVAVVEALIPGTQFIPTLTLAWVVARFTGRALPGGVSSVPPGGRIIDHEPSQRRREL